MMPVAIYARYSTDEQDPRSIEDQVRQCTEHAKRHRLGVVAEFADAAVSGSHTDREQLRRMLDAATATRRPPFRAVLVDDLSRLSRNMGDFWRVVDDLAGAGVNVIDVQTGMSSDDPNARMVFGAKSLVNDQFLQMVRYQTHRGLTGRALAGFSTGGSQYGYRTIAEANPNDVEHPRKLWVIDENEADIVRRIFDLYDRGAASYKSIAETFNRERIPAPRDGRKGHKIGFGWNHTSVRSILMNEKYIGVWTWNTHKWTAVPGKRQRRRIARPESEHVTKEMPELAIIDRATWDRVQTRIGRVHHVDKSGTRRGRPAGSGSRPYLVSGLLKCGVCGGPMSISGQRVKNGIRYAQFGCTAHRSRGASVCANSETISEKKITGSLIAALKDALASDELREVFARAFERRVNERSKTVKPVDLERQLEAAQRRVANATRLIVEMPDDLDLRRQRETDKAEVRRIQAAIAELAKAKTATRAVPDRKAISAALDGFLDRVATAAPEQGREVLAKCLTPLKITPVDQKPEQFGDAPIKFRGPKNKTPGLVVTGRLDLRAVLANSSSGGGVCTSFYAISRSFSAVWHLAVGRCR